jgi:hypothetical protein
MSTKTPTGMFPSKEQLQSGDRVLGKNKGPEKWNLMKAATTDPVAGNAGGDQNAAIVEKTAAELASQYTGVYKPEF